MLRLVLLSFILVLATVPASSHKDFGTLFGTKKPVYFTPAPCLPCPSPTPSPVPPGPPTVTPGPTPTAPPTVTPATVTPTEPTDTLLECKFEDDQDGFCVEPKECSSTTTSGQPGFIFSKKRSNECPGTKICCSFDSITNSTTTNPDPINPSSNDTKTPGPVDPVLPFQNTSLSSKQGCGWRNEDFLIRSVGGDEAFFGEFNYALPIFKIERGREKYVSGGSLIHPRLVLTYAARFKRKGSFIVKAGDYDILNTYEVLAHQTIPVEKVVTHPEFNSGSMRNNIAILVLKDEVKPARHIGYACLPTATTRPAAGTECIAIGWGADTEVNGTIQSTPKMIKVPVLTREDCETKVRPHTKPDFTLHSSVMCAGGVKNEDVCKGDGGSPLVCEYPDQEGRYYQAGVVSWGLFCGKEEVPSMYSDVAALRPWIDSTIAAEGLDSKYFTP